MYQPRSAGTSPCAGRVVANALWTAPGGVHGQRRVEAGIRVSLQDASIGSDSPIGRRGIAPHRGATPRRCRALATPSSTQEGWRCVTPVEADHKTGAWRPQHTPSPLLRRRWRGEYAFPTAAGAGDTCRRSRKWDLSRWPEVPSHHSREVLALYIAETSHTSARSSQGMWTSHTMVSVHLLPGCMGNGHRSERILRLGVHPSCFAPQLATEHEPSS